MKTINIVSIKMVKESRMSYLENQISDQNKAAEILRQYIGDVDREHLVVMTLDTKNRINTITTVSIGTLNAAIATPREVFKTAILSNAAGIVVGHNHPSGDPTPSAEDIEFTERLASVGEIMGIEILDHIIIGDTSFRSLKELGVI